MCNFKTSDITPNVHNDAVATPKCPLCGATTVLARMHKAEEAAVNVFRCTQCGVLYPVAKKKAGESA